MTDLATEGRMLLDGTGHGGQFAALNAQQRESNEESEVETCVDR